MTIKFLSPLATLLLLAACGGGGSSSSTPVPVVPAPLEASATFAQQCTPTNTDAPADRRTGSLSIEKQWVRSYLDESYLWYDQVPVVNADLPAYSDASDVVGSLKRYLDALKPTTLTASGKKLDKFSTLVRTSEINARLAGSPAGSGIRWAIGGSADAVEVRVSYVEPGSPADVKGVRRGDTLVRIGFRGRELLVAKFPEQVGDFIAALDSPNDGETLEYGFSRAEAAAFQVSITNGMFTASPVLSHSVVTADDGARIGNLVFTQHILSSQAALVAAVNDLKAQQISDLVLDLRYNGGGLAAIASQLAYMIAGPARTQGKAFAQKSYNRKRVAEQRQWGQPHPIRRCELRRELCGRRGTHEGPAADAEPVARLCAGHR